MRSKRPRIESDESDENADNAVKPTPRTASSLKHLTGYADAAREGELTYGNGREPVKNPTNVYAIDDAIEAVRTAKTCAVCEEPTCTAKATYGANNPSANPRRCQLHKQEKDVPVSCSHPGCTVKSPLVRRSSNPDGPAICLWHALMTENPVPYAFVRGAKTCTCGKQATFGVGKSTMVCGPCASVVHHHFGTELTQFISGNCAKRAQRQARDTSTRTAGSLKHLTGYADTARSGGLTFGDDRELVKNPASVFVIDDAIESVKSAKTCAVCEDPTCTAKATHGANHPRGAPRRCHLHKQTEDIPVACTHPGCAVKKPLVRRSSDPADGPAICLWHALATKTPASYAYVRGTNTCTCGKKAEFGTGKSRMVCGPCASVVNRHLGTELKSFSAGNCAKCGKRQGNDRATRIKTDEAVKVCRPCYIEIEAGGIKTGFIPGERRNACHEPGCKKFACLKKTADGTLSCPEHANGGGYERTISKCRGAGCARTAVYAANFGDTPVACSEHRDEETEFNVVNPRCRVCLATQLNWYDATIVKKRDVLCKGCTQEGGGPVIRFYEKTIVNAIISNLRGTGTKVDAVLDMPIQMHASTVAYRPDLVLRFDDKKTVFVEIDEGQHASYECERRREAAIFSSIADLDRDKIMIRINPDAGGAAFALFTKKPTANELLESDDGVDAFKTALFDQRLAEILDLCNRFTAGGIQPGHVHHINWTTDAPPRPLHS